MIDPNLLRPFLKTTIDSTDFPQFGERYQGKVRDVYTLKDGKRMLLVATDRQSAFDVAWCTIPLKGQVLSSISAWWFKQIAGIMPTHVLATPDPNVTLVKKLNMFKVELVVRGYLTGSSNTAAWTHYAAGEREMCGEVMPDGMVKNQPFPAAIVTPTTKDEHDEPINPQQIVERGLMTQEQWDEARAGALALFAEGQRIAAERGLILVDTKYEMGLDDEGRILVADEVHTPDSSRYWIASTYAERFAKGEEPESLDKEFFRLWLREAGYKDGGPKPEITDDVRIMLAAKYIDLYERVTGETFEVPSDPDVAGRIAKNCLAVL